VVFEDGVANEFLAMDRADRDKIRARGAITRANLDDYKKEKKKREKSGDPIEALQKLVDGLTVSKADRFNKGPREKLAARIAEVEADNDTADNVKALAAKLNPLLTEEKGAADHKTQMLALFSTATAESSASGKPAEPTTETTGESPQ